MTRQPRELDALLSAYFRDGPVEAPDRVLDATVEQLSRTPQDRRRWQPWRFEMSDRMRLGLAAAAVVVVLAAGAAILGRPQTPPVASSPSPSAQATPLASPSAGAPATPAPSPTSPTLGAQIGAGQRAATRLNAALQAAFRAGAISATDNGLLGADLDAVRLSLGEASLTLARRNDDSLTQRLASLSPAPTGPAADEVRNAAAALGNALAAVGLPTGPIPAGSYVSAFFARPFLVLGLGDGWTRYLDDSEVFAIKRGEATLAFHHTATAVTQAAMEAAIGRSPAFTEGPMSVTIGTYAGLVGQTPAGGTMWFDAALNAYDPAPGDVIRIWVLTVEQRPLTIELVGPPSEVAALRSDVEGLLATFVAYQAP